MGSHNGTYVNGEQILAADLKDGDQIRAGHTILRVNVERPSLRRRHPPTVSFQATAAAGHRIADDPRLCTWSASWAAARWG